MEKLARATSVKILTVLIYQLKGHPYDFRIETYIESAGVGVQT